MEISDEPFYVADLSHIAKQYFKWSQYLPSIDVYYSVKTNGSRFILEMMDKLGSGFDCASISELNSILSFSPDFDCSKRIIYSHPSKPISHLKYFQSKNVELTVVDNLDELRKLHFHWPSAKILLRLKVENSNCLISFSSKFGLNETMAKKLFEEGKRLELNLIGCSFHIGTGSFDLQSFDKSLKFARRIFDLGKEFHFNLTLLDIGGGFSGLDHLGKPSFEQMTETIRLSIEKYFPNHRGEKKRKEKKRNWRSRR